MADDSRVGGSYSTPDPRLLEQRERVMGVPQNEIICDFCSSPNPTWDYENYPTKNDDGGWAACDECHRLIQANDREALLRRSVQRAPVRHTMPDGIARSIRIVHATFWNNRKEDPKPIS